jgi:hypothetical protein
MWSGILAVPPLIVWYATTFEGMKAYIPSSSTPWLPHLLLGAFVSFGVIALAANAVAHSKIDRLLSENSREALPLGHPWTVRPLPAPPAPTDAMPVVKDRIIVKETPGQLCGLLDGHTTIQGQKLIEAYLGKWIVVSGQVADVSVFGFGERALKGEAPYASLELHVGEKRILPNVTASFGAEWIDRLSVLRTEVIVTVMGEIKDIASYKLRLANCELHDS